MPEEHEKVDERQAFIDARAKVIGATDSPKILGLSQYGTSLSVYHDKVSPEPPGEMSLPAWLGLAMQSTVGELYTTATGRRLRAANKHYVMPGFPYIGCHLDFRVWHEPKRLVEAKTRAYMKGFGEDGTTHIPVEIWVQVQHEMMVTDAHWCDVAVLFGHHTFNVYPIPRDETFIERLLSILVAWRRDHWEALVPPEPTGHWRDTEIVRAEFPEHDDQIIGATPADEALAKRFRMAVVNLAQATTSVEEFKNKFRQIIGSNAGITGTFGTFTNKTSKDSESVDWEQVAVTYGNVIEDLLLAYAPTADDVELVRRLGRAQSVYETAVGLATTTKPGSPRFYMKWSEEVMENG